MKILQIGLEWFPERAGGLNRYYYDCCNYLPQEDIQLDSLLTGSSKINQDLPSRVIAVAPSKSLLLQRWRAMRKNYRQLVAQEKYDLIVSHFALYTFALLDLIGDRPLVTHFHGPWALESDVEIKRPISIWVKKQIEITVYRRSSQFIVLSQTFRDILHQEYQVPLAKIHIIPGGVDIDRFNIDLSPTESRCQLNWPQDRPIIFCIRRLAKRMGIENLITAMAQVRDRYPDILLYIAGKGALATTLQTQIEALELTNHVKLLGFMPDRQLPLCYRAANFSIVPTIALEGFGLIVVESLAAGTPVLGTPIGGIPEILNPFCADLVLAGCNPDELARGMIETLSGKRILPSNQACLDYVQTNYNWQAIAQKIKLVYQSA
ncbi:MAG: glycosyltransferase family 4 protein [Pleurocapsa minor HA4230-MV1]|nr:glycosyltransferase family 4 protein [Pleurocapsa minor HA4230-MV1]